MNQHSVSEPAVDVSVVVPVVELVDDLDALFRDYSAALREMERSFEFIFVLDGRFRRLVEPLRELKRDNPEVCIVVMGESFGEAAALKAGASQARGSVLMTLASRFQVEGGGVRELLMQLDKGYDLVVTRRHPRIDSRLNRLQARVFHAIARLMTGSKFRDMTCGSRAMRAEVFDELHLYGDFHRFIPILAKQAGLRVKEVDVPQHKEDSRSRVFRLTVYLALLLDVLTLFFLTRFVHKPLRLFGTLGAAMLSVGFVISGYLALYRLLGFGGIANRPLLLLGILMIVFGMRSRDLHPRARKGVPDRHCALSVRRAALATRNLASASQGRARPLLDRLARGADVQVRVSDA
jgi:glycosyltransferase involved in cell wall biosynthesis